MATGLRCTHTPCEYTTTSQVPDDTDLVLKVKLLKVHNTVHTQGGAGADHVPGVKAKMDAPKLQLGVDQQTWEQFMTRWKIFKTTMRVNDADAPSWLFNCLDKDLGDEVIKANPGNEPQTMTEAALTASIKKLAVKVESKLLHRIKMGKLQQDPGVSVNNYLAALRGQSPGCPFLVEFLQTRQSTFKISCQIVVIRDTDTQQNVISNTF